MSGFWMAFENQPTFGRLKSGQDPHCNYMFLPMSIRSDKGLRLAENVCILSMYKEQSNLASFGWCYSYNFKMRLHSQMFEH